jgi:hypothetical protein
MFNTQVSVLAPDGNPLVPLATGELWNPQAGTTLVPLFDVGQAARLAQQGTSVFGLPPSTGDASAQLVLLSPAAILAPRIPGC